MDRVENTVQMKKLKLNGRRGGGTFYFVYFSR